MKYWWKNVVKNYFTFTARERNGLIILFSSLVFIYTLSRYLTIQKPPVSKDAFQQELAQLKIVIDSSHGNRSYERNENYIDYSQPKQNEYANNFERKLFDFDPNTLNETGWKKLGISEKTIHTIQKFLASGYKFRQPEDITKIYGLRKEDAKELMPFIHITSQSVNVNASYTDSENSNRATSTVIVTKKFKVFDINTADTSEFISLPGIGSKLAARIVNFRQKLGGFSSVAQLGETYGLPDSTFQKIRPRLQCINPALKTININAADINELRSHPYLRWNIANAIINYRQQHGNYKSVEDIKKIDIITDEVYKKISPYLAL